MALIKASDILSGKVKMRECKTSPTPERDLGDALEEAGFTALAGHPGIRRRAASATRLANQSANDIAAYLADRK